LTTTRTLPDEDMESQIGHRTYSPVDVKMDNTFGVVFLGLLSLILLFMLMREQARNRALLEQHSR
jgi:hypothetical protein